MTRNVTHSRWTIALLIAAATTIDGQSLLAGPAQQAMEAAAQNQQFAFVLFYRQNDAATQGMQRILDETVSARNDAVVLSVLVPDPQETALIEQFDATRVPLPAVAVLAPNGAVTGVYPQRVTVQHLAASIVSPGQAACLKALQEQKIVLLCVHPEGGAVIPDGVQQFKADELYRDRTQLVSVQANDPAEQRFLRQLDVPTDLPVTVTAFMAPPGVMLGTYKANVPFEVLAQRLAGAGKCCDDPNCKHHQSAKGSTQSRRR